MVVIGTGLLIKIVWYFLRRKDEGLTAKVDMLEKSNITEHKLMREGVAQVDKKVDKLEGKVERGFEKIGDEIKAVHACMPKRRTD